MLIYDCHILAHLIEKCIFYMPKGFVTCMDKMFRKMAGNMNGLGTGRKLEGERGAHGTKSVLYASFIYKEI